MRHAVLTLLLVTSALCYSEPDPPEYHDLIGNARWMVKYSNITLVSTHSHFLEGFPFAQNKAVADGPYDEANLGTGIPYIYNSPIATLTKDFLANPKVTLTYSAEFTHFCAKKNYDNDDPRCGEVMLSGELVLVTDADEIAWAKRGMFTRHPATSHWPPSHNFAFYRLNPSNIFALDYFGGAKPHLNITEYLLYKPKWEKLDL